MAHGTGILTSFASSAAMAVLDQRSSQI
jgi:hypothetical protein